MNSLGAPNKAAGTQSLSRKFANGSRVHNSFQRVAWTAVIAVTLIPAFAGNLTAGPSYSQELSSWLEVQVPPNTRSDRAVWDFSANYSGLSWRVSLDGNKPRAQLIERPNDENKDSPPFDARANSFRGAKRFKQVDDGWLVGFNHGEFGAALYWFDREGKHPYKISDDQVVDFFSIGENIFAVEGLAHMGSSCGNVVRLLRPTNKRWQSIRVARLPYAPQVVATRRDGTAIIALTDALVSFRPDYEITTLIDDPPWAGLYPSSAIVVNNDSQFYLGMRQYVAEVDLRTYKLRLLVPSRDFLNRLPEDDEARIRKQYSSGIGDWRAPANLCEEIEAARKKARNGAHTSQ